jgi:hypothetical protein
MHEVFKSSKNSDRRPAEEASHMQRSAGTMATDSKEEPRTCCGLGADHGKRQLL